MSQRTTIEWCNTTWNPTRGCSRVSEGCRNCYAERIAARFAVRREPVPRVEGGEVVFDHAATFAGFAEMTLKGPRWTGRVELIEDKLDEPLRWKKPRRVFVNSMSDLFHESLPDDAIDRVFAVMAQVPKHDFLVLTKRAERMRGYIGTTDNREHAVAAVIREMTGGNHSGLVDWPLPNVWLGVSVEDQPTADERIQPLLETPAAKRFVSYEPAIEPVNFHKYVWKHHDDPPVRLPDGTERAIAWAEKGGIDQIIVGGESGPGARPFDIAWARSTIKQCREAGVACFVKQLGARPFAVDGSVDAKNWAFCTGFMDDLGGIHLKSRKGGDMQEWPEVLRVREFPSRSGSLPGGR